MRTGTRTIFVHTKKLFLASVIGACAAMAAPVFAALAQAPSQPKLELEKRQGAEYRLESFGPDLLGDGIDPHTGSIQFSQTDVSLPGNFGLEVAIRRKRAQGNFYNPGAPVEFGDWQIDVPRMHVVSPETINWNGARCSTPFATAFPDVPGNDSTPLRRDQYTNGLILDAGSSPGQQVLQTPFGAHWPAGTTHVTVESWRLECSTAQDGGEGFLAYAPNGDQYKFDVYYAVDAEGLGAGHPQGVFLERKRHILAASRVTDVNGNTVDYNYDASARLTHIEASDGRRIDLTYSGSSKLIQSVTANPGTSYARTWTYTYGTRTTNLDNGRLDWPLTNSLIGVTLPDSRQWTFDMAGMSANPGLGRICPQEIQSITLTHPYGTVGLFSIGEIRIRQSLNQRDQDINTCPFEDISGGDPTRRPYILRLARVMATTSKTLIGPNLPLMSWTYSYERDSGQPGSSESDPTNWTRVVDPAGHQTTYYHNWTRQPHGGKLARKEVRQSVASLPLETVSFTYVQEAEAGYPLGDAGHATASYKLTLPASETITREGHSITSTTTYDNIFSSPTYSFGAPIQTVKGSSLGGSRTELLTYEHNKPIWVLRRLKTSTMNGRLYDSYDYDANGRVIAQSKFGTPFATFSYHTATGSAGVLATYTNALSQVSQFNSWKRGQPQQIVRPDLKTISRVVDDNGWVRSQTDAKNNTTSFDYTISGWLTAIDLPSPWADGALAYTGLGTENAYSTATVGSVETTVWYDAFLRPLQVRTKPLTGGGKTSYVKTVYDGLGRTTFTSLPSETADPSTGMQKTYDALNRERTSVDTITSGTVTTDYLPNGQTRVRDPKNNETLTTRRFYGSLDAAEITRIDQPLGLVSTFTYDTYGNMTSLNQAGTHNGYAPNVTRNFWYDARSRLCRHRAPELGDELFGYDALDRLTQKASGLAAGTDCAAPPAAERTVTNYDTLGRIQSIDYPGTTPDITNGFDDNGNLTSVARNGINWTYDYNTIDALSLERLQLDGRTYEFTYNYTPEGFLTTATMPVAGTVAFSPNGLGQATGLSAGGAPLASAGAYFVNGQMSALNLQNGQVFSATQNSRQLITASSFAGNGVTAFSRGYAYDAVLPRLTGITDNVASSENRGFGYDALNRLETASGPWGAGTFKYDLLGNLRQQVLGSRTIDADYDATNRVNKFKDSAVGPGWQPVMYDARGNVITRSGQGFGYDAANQPVSSGPATALPPGVTTYPPGPAYDTLIFDGTVPYVERRPATPGGTTGTDWTIVPGGAEGTYVYDGNLKRVKQTVNGKTIYSVYSTVSGKISVIDNVTSGERFALLNLGPVSIRFRNPGGAEYTAVDHLGSPVASTNAAGALLWRESYNPFGEKRIDPAANRDRPGFTGHIDDDATGLTYMQARYYDPVLGRFLSTDPIGYQDQLNLYAYVANDPVSKIDLTGMASVCAGTTGTRVMSCVKVDGNGDGNVKDNDLTSSQERNLARDFRAFILNNDGRDISGDGKPVDGFGPSDRLSSVRATSQFVGAAISDSQNTGLQNAWGRLQSIWVYPGVGPAPAWVLPSPRQTYWDSKGNMHDISDDLRNSNFTMTMSGAPLDPARPWLNFYRSPTNLARVMIHETMHGQYYTPRPGQHLWLDNMARSQTGAFGLGGGTCWAGRGFNGGC